MLLLTLIGSLVTLGLVTIVVSIYRAPIMPPDDPDGWDNET